jgi:prophage tail gpP-like protein
MDQVGLVVNNTRIEHFLSFRIETDLYTADHAFCLEVAKPETVITGGLQCKLYVNDQLALTGITDRVTRGYDKCGLRLRVEGRDLMGLLVDSCCGQFMTLKGVTLQSLAETLLAKVPFVSIKNVSYQEGIVASSRNTGQAPDAGSSLQAGDTPQAYTQVEPSKTIFDVLNNYARSRGFMFFSLPNGSFVFGRPQAKGAAQFNIVSQKPGPMNNAIWCEEVSDYSKRFSQVTVMGQQQGTNAISAAQVNTSAVETDPTFPFYKPFVALDNNDQESPALHARAIMEKMKVDGYGLTYKVKGLTQNGRAWTINELCNVNDGVLGVTGQYLVTQRIFEMGKDGVFTTVKLGPPGLVA